LLKTHVQPEQVLYMSHNSTQVLTSFANRLESSRAQKEVVITLRNLQRNDSDNYVCAEKLKNSSLLLASGTMVVVQEGEQTCSGTSWGTYALAVLVALLFCALVCCTLYRLDVKKYFQKPTPNVIYEDMSYSSRRSTLVR
ncbi:T-cell antigen CD7, partial [Acanthisitta chloris]